MSETGLTIEQADPKDLVRESFRIESISAPECRSIFIDWALSLAPGVDAPEAARLLIDHYAPKAVAGKAAHPMVQVLVEGAASRLSEPPRRRGGRAGRVGE